MKALPLWTSSASLPPLCMDNDNNKNEGTTLKTKLDLVYKSVQQQNGQLSAQGKQNPEAQPGVCFLAMGTTRLSPMKN